MSKKLMVSIILATLILAFPISANNDLAQLRLYYYPEASSESPELSYTAIIIPAAFTAGQRAIIIFSMIFDDFFDYNISFTPADVRLLAVYADCNHLIIDVCANILNYGGTYFEYRLTNRLLQNAAGLNFSYFTLLIEGEMRYLPEGTLLYNIPLEKY